MELGQFSVSLAVKDIAESKVFYEALGFTTSPDCGGIDQKWLILQNGNTVIGLFEGMFEANILTFNPPDVRAVQARLEARGIEPEVKVAGDSGPGHCIVRDPDGNQIMFDQF